MPQRKKKPITVGKRTSYMTGKRPVSAKPSQASKVRAAKKTTSSKYRARRQAASKATVTTGGQGTPGSAKVTTGRGRSGPKLPKLPSKSAKVTRGGATGRAPMPKESAARKAARLANRAAKGYGRQAAGMVLKGAAKKALGPLSAGLTVGKMMQKLPKNVSTSGRGSGRAAFKPKKKKR